MNKCLYCGKPVKNKYCNPGCENKHLLTGKKRRKELTEKQIQTVKNKWKTFTVNCFICGKEIEIKEFNVHKPKKKNIIVREVVQILDIIVLKQNKK